MKYLLKTEKNEKGNIVFSKERRGQKFAYFAKDESGRVGVVSKEWILKNRESILNVRVSGENIYPINSKLEVLRKKFSDLLGEYKFKSQFSNEVDSLSYGIIKKPVFTVCAKNTDDQWVRWFSVIPSIPFVKGSDTDCLNIWLSETRPDMTAEKCLEFFSKLNSLFGLKGEDRILIKNWIDPEDWQSIADVNDAYEDSRYKNN